MAFADRTLLDYIAAHPGAGREEIRRHVAPTSSGPTVWRALKRLVGEGQLAVSGRARATGYRIAGPAVVRAHLRTPCHRRRLATYNREFIDRYVPGKVFYLGETERGRLHDAGRPVPFPPPAGTHARRILERLLVDLSWASSRMEATLTTSWRPNG